MINPIYGWTQPIVPSVVDDALSYYEVLGKLSTKMDEVITEVNSIKVPAASINTKNIIVVGDSYGSPTSVSPALAIVYPQIIQQYLGIDNARYNYKCVSGSGFANGRYLQNLQAISITKPEKVTDIYVFGGWNDVPSRFANTLVWSQAEAFANYCKTNYPSAKLHLGFISWTSNLTPARRTDLTGVYNTYLQCIQYGFDYLPNVQYILHNDAWFSADQTHPNLDGQYALGKGLAQAITGTLSYYIGSGVAVTPANGTFMTMAGGGGTASFNAVCRRQGDGSMTNLSIAPGGSVYWTPSSPQSMVYNGINELEFATINNPWINGYNYLTSENVPIMFRFTDNTGYVIPCLVKMDGKSLIVVPNWFTADGKNTFSGTILRMFIPKISIWAETFNF